eukprot:COSAG06_NODE_22446_length_723_cov_1.051282_1_plen_39_part_01
MQISDKATITKNLSQGAVGLPDDYDSEAAGGGGGSGGGG